MDANTSIPPLLGRYDKVSIYFVISVCNMYIFKEINLTFFSVHQHISNKKRSENCNSTQCALMNFSVLFLFITRSTKKSYLFINI